MARHANLRGRGPAGGMHPTPFEQKAQYVQKSVTICICLLILFYAGVFRGMFRSDKVNTLPLYSSFVLCGIFCGMWAYMIVAARKRAADLSDPNSPFVRFATITVVLGSLFWVVGMWPELGFFTVPLYCVVLTLIAHIVGLIPFHKLSKKD